MRDRMISKDICCIKGCDAPVIALGLCTLHWRRNRKYGSPVAIKSHSAQMVGLSAEERFFFQVKKTKTCWFWTAATDKNGYGVFRGQVGGVVLTKAHRFSYSIHTGELIPKGMVICHKCDNPSCVNPEHLFLGTHADNMRDKIAKGRARVPKGQDSVHAKLTEAQARSILLDPRPYRDIARDYGIAYSTVGSIKQRESWEHVEVAAVARSKKTGARGVDKWSTHLTEADIREIRLGALSGKELAEKFSVSPQTICDIQKRRSWKHIE